MPTPLENRLTRQASATLVGRVEEIGSAEHGILDRDLRALTLGGDRVSLTPLEFRLVEFLDARQGATATRDEVLDRVWGKSCTKVGSNVVNAVVKSLRRKLGTEAGRPQTVRGFGYRWRMD